MMDEKAAIWDSMVGWISMIPWLSLSKMVMYFYLFLLKILIGFQPMLCVVYVVIYVVLEALISWIWDPRDSTYCESIMLSLTCKCLFK